jgi:hypothetical protein
MRGSLALLGALALGGVQEASGTRLLRQYSWLVSGASASAPAAAASSPMAAATGPSATPSSDTVKTVESGSANDGSAWPAGPPTPPLASDAPALSNRSDDGDRELRSIRRDRCR